MATVRVLTATVFLPFGSGTKNDITVKVTHNGGPTAIPFGDVDSGQLKVSPNIGSIANTTAMDMKIKDGGAEANHSVTINGAVGVHKSEFKLTDSGGSVFTHICLVYERTV